MCGSSFAERAGNDVRSAARPWVVFDGGWTQRGSRTRRGGALMVLMFSQGEPVLRVRSMASIEARWRRLGGRVLREVSSIGVTARMSRYFVDYRNPASVEHSVAELVLQRIYAIALGYEDLDDHERLRGDRLLSLLVGKSDVTGETRIRVGHRLARIVLIGNGRDVNHILVTGGAGAPFIGSCLGTGPLCGKDELPAAGGGPINVNPISDVVQHLSFWDDMLRRMEQYAGGVLLRQVSSRDISSWRGVAGRSMQLNHSLAIELLARHPGQ